MLSAIDVKKHAVRKRCDKIMTKKYELVKTEVGGNNIERFRIIDLVLKDEYAVDLVYEFKGKCGILTISGYWNQRTLICKFEEYFNKSNSDLVRYIYYDFHLQGVEQIDNFYGTTLNRLWDKANKIFLRKYVSGKNKHIMQLLARLEGLGYIIDLVNVITNSKSIQEAIKNGTYGIIPLLLKFQSRSVEEIRAGAGKAAWKYLHKCTLKRACVVTQFLKYRYSVEFKKPSHEWLNIIKNTSTTRLLKYLKCDFDNATVMWCEKGKIPIYYVNRGLRLILRDTLSMQEQLGDRRQLPNSVSRLEELHNELTQSVNAHKHSKNKICERVTMQIGGVLVESLISAFEIAQEGIKMHHCVASYVGRVREGDYMVFHLEDKGGTKTTLGLRKQGMAWEIDQHYGPHNTNVNKDFQLVAEYFLDSFNKVECRNE